jgi:hypothetical protein
LNNFFIYYIIRKGIKEMPVFRFIFAIIAAALLASCSSIVIQTYSLESLKVAENTNIRIVLIADLHDTVYGKNQATLIEMTRDANPDLIILAGDIIDDRISRTGTQLLLSGIYDIAPIYYVTGNHEYMSGNIQKIRDELTSFGVIILSDAYELIEVNGNEIVLAGIEDPYKKRFEAPDYDQIEAMEIAFRELDDMPNYKILIAHRPELIEIYRRYSFDLVLSGHTHGGQVRIPNILNGLYVPHQGFFPKYGGGIYNHAGITHIISRGLSVMPLLPRILNPPEFVIINIVSRLEPR